MPGLKKSRKFNLELSSSKIKSSDDLSGTSSCALSYEKSCCKGLGFRVATKGPYAFASLCTCVEQCHLCHGRAQLVENKYAKSCQLTSPVLISRLINNAQIPARYAHAHLADFANKTGNCQNLIQRITSWEKQLTQSQERGLLISGPVGIGKTFILASIAKSLAIRGIKVRFIDFFQLITQIKACYANHQSEQTLLMPLLDVDVLVIDELGKGRNTDFELTILDQLIMGRYNQKKVIVASTNCTILSNETTDSYGESNLQRSVFAPDDFGTLESRVGKRIYSRLVETNFFFSLKGEDFRRRKGAAWIVPLKE